jgi:hypothetical protein
MHVRGWFLALLGGVLLAGMMPVAAHAAETPGIESFVAINCNEPESECGSKSTTINLGPPFGEQTYVEPEPPKEKEAREEGFVQAGGRVPSGVTDFKVNTVGSLPFQKPTATVEHIRTDVAPGLATNPTAVPQCSLANFGATEAFPGSGTGFYAEPKCAGSEIGTNKVTVYLPEPGVDLALEGTVYNLEPSAELASEFGVALKLPKAISAGGLKKLFKFLEEHGQPVPSTEEQEAAEAGQYFAHTLIEGNVEWGKQANGTNQGDYHDYFEIKVSKALPLIASRLVFAGTSGKGDFVTNATSCPGHNTTTLKLTDHEETTVKDAYTAPIGLEGCDKVPFLPSFALTPGASGSDEPDGITTEVGLPQNPKALETSQLKQAVVTLPEGMTLNPSAAAVLTACTPTQARIHSSTPGTSCPSSSELGTVSLEVPTLPPGSLTGKIYLGGPDSGPITGSPYTIYVDAESHRYGVSVRLKGEVETNAATGQVTAMFPKDANDPNTQNPEQPFTNLKLQFNGGALAPIANPLGCSTGKATASFIPFSEPGTTKTLTPAFTATGCSSPVGFAPTQATANQTANAGAKTSFTLNFERGEGQQYLTHSTTVLPPGLVGAIPVVTQCPEALANTASCEASSLIGGATVESGSGLKPYTLSGSVYLTGPYHGAPFGLEIAIPVEAGPFKLGVAVARASLNVDQNTARVVVTSDIPTIVNGGIVPRLRKISVSIDKQGFMSNPTNCSVLATESTLSGSLGATKALSTPFQVANCGALAFKPTFKAVVGANTSKANGASLETTINEPAGGANLKSVVVQLPKQLPSRLTTLQKACPEATFKANPLSCPVGSLVGSARANTPVLPGKLTGPAYLVSHGGAAFPDLDLVLQANGVRVIVVGNTNIKNGITTTSFLTTPDVPVSSVTVNLPTGPHSALTAFGNVCSQPLVMPTTITGQNGLVIKRNTRITVKGCGVRIVGHKVVGNTAYVTVTTPAAGRISGSGGSLATVYRHLNSAQRAVSLRIPLSRNGRSRGRPFHTRIRVGFVPRRGAHSVAYVTVTFR